jgi:hypothetical protein
VIIPKRHIDSVTSLNDPNEQLAKDFISVISQVAAIIEANLGGVAPLAMLAPISPQSICIGMSMQATGLGTRKPRAPHDGALCHIGPVLIMLWPGCWAAGLLGCWAAALAIYR